jgi:S-adenosylmethionine hydrolase
MRVITLTSDLGHKDNYVALLKAVSLTHSPSSLIVDICHEIEKFNIVQASYIFSNAFGAFPENSIHVVGVKSANSRSEKFLLIQYKKQFILCPDNGFFTLFYDHSGAEVYKIKKDLYQDTVFFMKDVLMRAACDLANGKPVPEMADKTDDYVQLISFQPTSTPSSIIGRCLYMDSFGNVITNITKDFFEGNRRGRTFTIHLPGHRINEISSSYDDVPEISALALFNTSGHLEIAINKGQARQLLFPKNINLHTDFHISVEFDE